MLCKDMLQNVRDQLLVLLYVLAAVYMCVFALHLCPRPLGLSFSLCLCCVCVYVCVYICPWKLCVFVRVLT